MRFVSTPEDGWCVLPEGCEALYVEGLRLAEIWHHPERQYPFVTTSVGPDGSKSLRNLDTREAAKAHCERVVFL